MFLTRLLLSLILASACAVCNGASLPPDYRFQFETLAENLPQPMELELAPDGRIFVNELNGALKILKPGAKTLITAGEIPVFNQQENGFLGFALDPGFASNQWIFVFYSPKDYVGARISRFTMKGDQMDPTTEVLILEFPEHRLECCHHAGSVEFGPGGLLYASTGDNTHPAGDSDGYAPIDERPGRMPYDAQKSSANTHDLRGKILRILPKPEGGYSIPEGNLFPKDGSKGRPEIFVMGCRNPWRMSVDQRTGIVYWGEVGPDAGGDGKRGSRGYDEINQAKTAGNFGWPYFVGSNSPYADWDFSNKVAGPLYSVAAPINESPNNTGARVLPPAQPAFIYWPYGESKEFPILGSGGRTACAGPVFHFQPSFRQTGGFPEYFDRSLLFFDWQRPFLMWARLDEESRLKSIESFTSAAALANDRDRANKARTQGKFVIQRPVDALFGPDGCLYLLDYGESWGPNKDSRLIKVSYQWGNLPPVAKISSDVSAGMHPLTVKLSSQGSADHEGDALGFEWSVHPTGRVFSRDANPSLTLDQPGNYSVQLALSDSKGAVSRTSLSLIVGNSTPTIRFLAPQDGDFFTPGQALKYKVTVNDREDGSSEEDEDWLGARTMVNATWMGSDGKSVEADPGLSLMKQSDCFNCHATETRIVGPAFLEVANKYRGKEGSIEDTITRVIKGSSRVWGEAPMLPHESLHPDQVRMMVRWIYALEPGKGGANLMKGISGSISVPTDSKFKTALLEASYTDGGNGQAGPLSSSTAVRLRSRQLEAESADEKVGPMTLGPVVGAIDHGHTLRFRSLNLADVAQARLRVSSGGNGGTIELRAGSGEGPVLAEIRVEPTGSWDKYVELTTPLPAVPERKDLLIRFSNPGKGGLMNLDWIRLEPAAAAPASL